MSNTINFLLESDANYGLGLHGLNKNHLEFNKLEKITESQEQITGFTLEKLTLQREDEFSPYLIEYTGNLERYINDQKIVTIEEAIDNVKEYYELDDTDFVIVVDESCISKIDIAELANKYKVVRK